MADEVFRDVGLAPSYAFLLMAVNQQPGIQPSDLGTLLHLNPSTITRLVEKMEYRGYLERRSIGRATEIYPTEKCIQQDAKIKAAWEKLKTKYTSILGERYTEVLTEMTAKAVENLK